MINNSSKTILSKRNDKKKKKLKRDLFNEWPN